jgi:hypothetical protein
LSEQRFLRQATEFEKLAKVLKATAKTEQDKLLVQVAEDMVKVCEMLAEYSEQVMLRAGG